MGEGGREGGREGRERGRKGRGEAGQHSDVWSETHTHTHSGMCWSIHPPTVEHQGVSERARARAKASESESEIERVSVCEREDQELEHSSSQALPKSRPQTRPPPPPGPAPGPGPGPSPARVGKTRIHSSPPWHSPAGGLEPGTPTPQDCRIPLRVCRVCVIGGSLCVLGVNCIQSNGTAAHGEKKDRHPLPPSHNFTEALSGAQESQPPRAGHVQRPAHGSGALAKVTHARCTGKDAGTGKARPQGH